MSLLYLRAPRLTGAAFTLSLLAFFGSAACGQEGIVAVTSTGGTAGTAGTTGGAGAGAGGAGGSSGSSTGGAGSSGSSGTGGAAVPQEFKILTWNLHNFFDTNDDPAISNEDEQILSLTKYNNKLASVAAVIEAMDPDIAVLPEIENLAILDQLNESKLAGSYKTAITATNDFRGLDIGILSKEKIDDVVTHAMDSFKRLDLVGGQSYKYSRDAVEVHVTYNTRRIILLGVHYRSKGDGSAETDDKDKRMAEAQHTREIADGLAEKNPKAAIMILGDFNDLPGSPPVNWTLQGNPKNSPKVIFTASADSVAEAERYTFVYNGTMELIDHQMMNPVLHKFLDPAKVVIRHGSDVEAASDHHPMMATFNIQ